MKLKNEKNENNKNRKLFKKKMIIIKTEYCIKFSPPKKKIIIIINK